MYVGALFLKNFLNEKFYFFVLRKLNLPNFS